MVCTQVLRWLKVSSVFYAFYCSCSALYKGPRQLGFPPCHHFTGVWSPFSASWISSTYPKSPPLPESKIAHATKLTDLDQKSLDVIFRNTWGTCNFLHHGRSLHWTRLHCKPMQVEAEANFHEVAVCYIWISYMRHGKPYVPGRVRCFVVNSDLVFTTSPKSLIFASRRAASIRSIVTYWIVDPIRVYLQANPILPTGKIIFNLLEITQ